MISTNILPKRVIISFDFYKEIYNSVFINNNDFIYLEITKQIFDVMDPRLSVFMQKIETLPNFNLIPLTKVVYDEINIRRFKELIKVYALNIFFTCFHYKLFINGSLPYILESMNKDCCVLYLAE